MKVYLAWINPADDAGARIIGLFDSPNKAKNALGAVSMDHLLAFRYFDRSSAWIANPNNLDSYIVQEMEIR